MSVEIEHKYLVANDGYKSMATESHRLVQGYLSREKGRTVRVRICDDKAFLTVKGANTGASRPEFEYEVPLADAEQMLRLCPPPVIGKTRHNADIVRHEQDARWEVDEFHGQLHGLTFAEIEIPSVDYHYEVPPFVGRDVTDDPRFYNSRLTTIEALKGAL